MQWKSTNLIAKVIFVQLLANKNKIGIWLNAITKVSHSITKSDSNRNIREKSGFTPPHSLSWYPNPNPNLKCAWFLISIVTNQILKHNTVQGRLIYMYTLLHEQKIVQLKKVLKLKWKAWHNKWQVNLEALAQRVKNHYNSNKQRITIGACSISEFSTHQTSQKDGKSRLYNFVGINLI